MKKENTARVLMALAMLIFGTLAPFVRLCGVSSGELALYRAFMAMFIVGGFLLFTRQKISFSKIKKDLFLLLFSGAAMGINWILLFEAYKYTTVSIATLSYYFAPVLVMALSPFLFRERLTAKKILCFVMSSVGLVLITGTAGGGKGDLIGIGFGLLAALFYATVMILNKFIRGVEGLSRTFIQFFGAIVVLLPYVIFTSGFTASRLGGVGIAALLTVGILHTGLAYCLYFSSIKDLPGGEIAILSYVDPMVAVLVSVFFLDEKITFLQIVGGLLILGFTLYCELPTKRALPINEEQSQKENSNEEI